MIKFLSQLFCSHKYDQWERPIRDRKWYPKCGKCGHLATGRAVESELLNCMAELDD